MADPDFTIKRGDTVPLLEATLTDADGPIDLTGASVELIMKQRPPGVATVIGNCNVVDASTGLVTYIFSALDTASVGLYDLEFQITFTGGGIETVPNDHYKTVEVKADLGD